MSLHLLQLDAVEETQHAAVLSSARSALRGQAEALHDAADALGTEFCRAVDVLSQCAGRIIVCGMGKSGLIGRKIAATFASSGTPSFFLHAADAAHGDLGMVTRADAMLLVSHSGSTEELLQLLPYFEELAVPVVALVGCSRSPLARAATVAICTRVEREICPHNVVVTTSALVALSIADALAVALMRRKNIGTAELGRRHPGGAIGRSLLQSVREVMHSQPLPLVSPDLPLRDAIVSLAAGRCGLLVAVDAVGAPVGLVGQTELAKAMHGDPGALDQAVSAVMSVEPATIPDNASVHAAEQKMQRLGLKALVVVDVHHRVVGVVQTRDGG